MLNIQRLLIKPAVWNPLIGGLLAFGCFSLAAILTLLFGDRCWPPRIGGILVGLSVFLQGYAWAHPEQFRKVVRTGHTTEQLAMQAVYVVTTFGTFMWALGDFLPPMFGVPMCRLSP